MATSPQAGRTGKVLGLLAAFTLIMGALIGIGFAPAASAAVPSTCPTGYSYDADKKLCVGTETVASQVSTQASGYECEAGWTLVGQTCTKPVEATKDYFCKEGTLVGTNCTEPEEWEFDDHDNEWECEATHTKVSGGTKPTTPCEKTEPADFNWVCETAVVVTPTLDSRHEDEKVETHHRGSKPKVETGKKKCGGSSDPKPTCEDLVIPATAIYPYVCPVDYTPNGTPITSATLCSKTVTTDPTCPAGQTLVEGECQTPAEPVKPVEPQNPAEPAQQQVAEPVVAAAVVEAPAEVPAEIAAASPQAATVAAPAKKPAVATVPQAATVPAAVPAGDGSSQQQFPLWTAVLVALVALTAAGAGFRLMGSRD